MYLFALIMSSKKLISRLRMQSLIIKSQVVSEIPEIRGGHTHTDGRRMANAIDIHNRQKISDIRGLSYWGIPYDEKTLHSSQF